LDYQNTPIQQAGSLPEIVCTAKAVKDNYDLPQDIAYNQLRNLEALKMELSELPALSSVRLEGNTQLPDDYQHALLDAVPSLDSVDCVDRPPPPPDVLFLEQQAGDITSTSYGCRENTYCYSMYWIVGLVVHRR
jgi:hypothetical protein